MSSSELKVLVLDGGDLEFVHDDRLRGLMSLGERTVTTRASHVEPEPIQGDGVRPTTTGWVADMGPSGGPVLRQENGVPFGTRQEALDAEREWLREHRGL